MRSARLGIYAFGLLALSLALAACDMGPGHNKVLGDVDVAAGASVSDANTVNGTVNVEANARAGDTNSVNGSISIASGGQVADAKTVNGSIKLGEHAEAKDATTVNGSVTLGRGATVSGNARSVNGALDLAPDSTVKGSLRNVNGQITVDDAHVGNGITTADGDIDIAGSSVIDGGIKVEESKGGGFLGIHFGSNKVPRVVVGAGATVNGPLTFEKPVKLYISDQAHVAGPINGAAAVKFSGATPPTS